MADGPILIVLFAAGLFSVILGLVHLVLPILLDFDLAIPDDDAPGLPPLRTLRLGPLRYRVKRSDVRGIGWVMSNAASYVLITVGVVDLLTSLWLGTAAARWLALWIAGWWLVRSVSQLALGRRRGDVLLVGWFGLLGVVHLGVALA